MVSANDTRSCNTDQRSARVGVSAVGGWIQLATSIALVSLVAGCAVPQKPATEPVVEQIARQQRLERAQANLNDGLRKYDSGTNDEAVKSFLLALDSGVLPLADQLNARKHLAFIYCLGGRELSCKEEFERAMALDPKFDLTPAEAGHPSWGPVHRLVKTEAELRRSGRALPAPTIKSVPVGEKSLRDAMQAYDDAEYNKAIKAFQDSLKEPLAEADQQVAHKFMAFSYCLTNRITLCRTEFEAVLRLNANFELAPAEAGHPSWGPSFRAVKAKQKSASPKKQ